MKKIRILAIVLVCMLALCGCDSNDYEEAMDLYEQGKYKEAKEIFLALDTYKDSEAMAEKCEIECSVEECIKLIDKLCIDSSTDYYSVRFSLEEYQDAFSKYYGLPQEHKSRITNADKLLSMEKEYEQCCAEEKIKQQVLAEATNVVKGYISRYAAASTYRVSSEKEHYIFLYWDENDPSKVAGSVTMYYSFENEYGRTEDREEDGYWEGTYKNGKFEITKMSFYDLESEYIEMWLDKLGH